MKSFRSTIVFITLLFSVLFIINTAVMYMFFDTNALNPVYQGSWTNQSNAETVSSPVQNEDSRGSSSKAASESDLVPDGTIYQQPDDKSVMWQEGTQNGNLDAGDPAAYYMTAPEVAYLDGLSLSDKLTALSVITKISKEEADEIYDMAGDGITFAEMKEIKSILDKYLLPQEIAELNGILEKNKRLYAQEKTLNNYSQQSNEP